MIETHRLRAAAVGCELMKLLRGMWLDRAQIAEQLDVSRHVAEGWCEELTAHGILVERKRPTSGAWAREFTLSTDWVGKG